MCIRDSMNAVHTRNRLRRPAPLRSRGAIQINRRSCYGYIRAVSYTHLYYNHSDYVGGMKETTLREKMAKKPEDVIYLAVKGMLPKGCLLYTSRCV